MDAKRGAVEAHLAEEWRAIATPLGHQPPLVMLRRTPTGGGELAVWWADAEAAVAATISRWRLPPLQPGTAAEASLPLVAPTVTAAASASWAAAAAAAGVEEPRTTLWGGQPAALTSTWASYEGMMAVMQRVVTPAAAGEAAAARGQAGPRGSAQPDRARPAWGGADTAGGGRPSRAVLALARVADKGVRTLAQATLAAVEREVEQRAQRVPAAAEAPTLVQSSAALAKAEEQAAMEAMTQQSELMRARQSIAMSQQVSMLAHEAAMRSTGWHRVDSRPGRSGW